MLLRHLFKCLLPSPPNSGLESSANEAMNASFRSSPLGRVHKAYGELDLSRAVVNQEKLQELMVASEAIRTKVGENISYCHIGDTLHFLFTIRYRICRPHRPALYLPFFPSPLSSFSFPPSVSSFLSFPSHTLFPCE